MEWNAGKERRHFVLPVLLWLAGGGFVISKLSFIIRNGSFPPQSANCSVKVLYRGEKKVYKSC